MGELDLNIKKILVLDAVNVIKPNLTGFEFASTSFMCPCIK